MATIKDSVYLEERIAREERKLAVLEARRTNPDTAKPYEPRSTTKILVPSFAMSSTVVYIVPVSTESLTQILGTTEATDLAKIGCYPSDAPPAGVSRLRNTYETEQYPKILIVHGDPSPTSQVTEWGTRWIKKYAKSGKQSHRLLPFGPPVTATTPSFDDVVDFFYTQFNQDGGDLAAVMGTGGSVSLLIGRNSTIATIKRS